MTDILISVVLISFASRPRSLQSVGARCGGAGGNRCAFRSKRIRKLWYHFRVWVSSQPAMLRVNTRLDIEFWQAVAKRLWSGSNTQASERIGKCECWLPAWLRKICSSRFDGCEEGGRHRGPEGWRDFPYQDRLRQDVRGMPFALRDLTPYE